MKRTVTLMMAQSLVAVAGFVHGGNLVLAMITARKLRYANGRLGSIAAVERQATAFTSY